MKKKYQYIVFRANLALQSDVTLNMIGSAVTKHLC